MTEVMPAHETDVSRRRRNKQIYSQRELSAKSAASLYPDASSTSVAETMISLLNPVKISGTPKISHVSTLLEATRTRI